jgi:uncharacterized repeat protein (TIGR01451 family)
MIDTQRPARRFLVAWIVAAATGWAPVAAIVVNSTGLNLNAPGAYGCDTGFLNAAGETECTLPAAVQFANSDPDWNPISFDIPTQDSGYDSARGWWTIQGGQTYQLSITRPATIDGYSQPGAQPNTLTVGDNAVIKIILPGILYVYGEGVTIRGLCLVDLRLFGARRAVIAGNFFGLDPTGLTPLRAGLDLATGIWIRGNNQATPAATGNTIGGPAPADRNLIAGYLNGIYSQESFFGFPMSLNTYENNYFGVVATGDTAVPNTYAVHLDGAFETVRNNVISGNTWGVDLANNSRAIRVQGNLIGLSADGAKSLGNLGHGVSVQGREHLIGGLGEGEGNHIAHNGLDGVWIYDASIRTQFTEVSGNSIHENGELGLDRFYFGPSNPRWPVITRAAADGVRDTIVEGTFDRGVPSSRYRIEVFANRECDPNGYGEGERYLTGGIVTTDASGHAEITPILGPPLPSTHPILTATATLIDTGGLLAGDTTESSPCFDTGLAPRLDVVKAASPEPVAVGDVLAYDLVVTNPLPQDVAGVVLEDDLPSGVTFLSADADQGTCSFVPPRVSCDLGTIAANGVVGVAIRVRADDEGTMSNVARAGNATSNEVVSTVVPVAPVATADFAVRLGADRPTPRPGDPVRFTVTIWNAGPDNAAAIAAFSLPPGLVSDPNGAPAVTAGAYDPATGIWSAGILLPHPQGLLAETLTIPARVEPGAPACIEASASVTPASIDTDDPEHANDAATVRLGTGACADLSIVVLDWDSCWYNAGGGIILTPRITNGGPDGADGVIVRTRAEVNGNQGSWLEVPECSTASPCTLEAGESRSLDDQGAFANCDDTSVFLEVEVTSSLVDDPDPANNQNAAGGPIEQTFYQCFIATAAYGSPLDARVQELRDFRDRRLLTNAPGRAFVSLYNRVSPPIAAVIARHPALRGAVRAALAPVVLAVEHPAAALGAGLAASGALAALVLRRRRRRGSRPAPRPGRVAAGIAALLAAASLAGEARAAAPPRSGEADASLARLTRGSDLVVVAQVLEAIAAPGGGSRLRVRVAEQLKGDHAGPDLVVGGAPPGLRPGDRAVLFLVPALRLRPRADREWTPGRFVFTKPGRYLLLPPDLRPAAERALARSIHATARLARSEASTREESRAASPEKRRRRRFTQVKLLLKADRELRRDAMQLRADLLMDLKEAPDAFALDPATADTLRDLAERLAVDAGEDVRDALARAVEAIEPFEGVTLTPAAAEEVRRFLKKLPGAVFGGG